MPSRPPIPRGIDQTSAADKLDAQSPSPNTYDLNRPLPPTPQPSSSLPTSYDIPSLRQKPPPDLPSDPASRHSRSHSHPFPSFFGSRKASKRGAEGTTNGDIDSIDGAVDPNLQRTKQTVTGPPKASGPPLTGRCMTCASTVRWPSDLKVFRCTTCLTINDLEPCDESGAAEPGDGHRMGRKSAPISVDLTRKLLDRCLREYLQQQLDQEGPDTHRQERQDNANLPSAEGKVEESRTAINHAEPKAAHTTRPQYQERSSSDPRSTNFKSAQKVEQASHLDGGSSIGHSGMRRETSSRDIPIRRPSTTGPIYAHNIFRPVESYISECCAGCMSLNMSFISAKPVSNKDDRQTRPVRQHPPETQITPSAEPDVFLSDLDAKTLLLGDVAENGSWWTNSKSLREEETVSESVGDQVRSRANSTVTVKTPRINWSELSEWYHVILYAGEEWRSRWLSMCPNETSELYHKWKSVSQEDLSREIIESRIHLHRCLLKATENLLKRPRRPLKNPEDCRFLLMLLANPLLCSSPVDGPVKSSGEHPRSRTHLAAPDSSPQKTNSTASRRGNGLGQHSGIIKRILGLLSSLSNELHLYFVSWFARIGDVLFQRLVELIGSFVTYRLTRQINKPVQEFIDPTEGLIPSFATDGVRHASQLHAAIGGRSNSSSTRKEEARPKVAIYGEDWQTRAAARVMALLFQANCGHNTRKRDTSITKEQRLRSAGMNAKHQAHVHGQILPINNFYNSMLDHADLITDFETWETTKSKFTFCQYPFFLSIWAKIHILEHDARRQMEIKAREAFFDSILSRKAVSQYLVLKVRRDCLVEDSLKNVSEVIGKGGSDIKKGLRIDFAGEEGIDAGGLRKEWFLLLVREIFNPDHGLFVYDEDSQFCYFNPFCFESSEQFFLVGVLLGLAIYNSTILDVAFPPFVFKKMLASAPSTTEKLTSTPKVIHQYSLDDLAELHPTLARGLRQLLEYEGDVQETFCRDFVVELDRYGENMQTPLCPGGTKRAVTNTNRREFVDLYVRYLLDTSVSRQYEPFKRGFFTVCGGNAMSLFRPEEIELLVRGSDEPLDVGSLRAVASYENWPKNTVPEEQPQVMWFWSFFEGLSPVDQRKLLSFITGSDRIPAMGATNLIIRIHLLLDKEADEKCTETMRFPIARTCFNLLGLYAYRTRATLEHKLWTAVLESEGFGLK